MDPHMVQAPGPPMREGNFWNFCDFNFHIQKINNPKFLLLTVPKTAEATILYWFWRKGVCYEDRPLFTTNIFFGSFWIAAF
jgi:hypothetical protein